MEPCNLDLTLATLERLEATRRLQSIPAALLESSWALEAQTEAVIDALLAVTAAGDRAYAHARHVGEWAARIAANLPCAPNTAFMRRCGALADLDPATLERVREVRDCAPVVREYQRLRMRLEAPDEIRTAALIVAVADEFDSLIFDCDDEDRHSPNDALRVMTACADTESRDIVAALGSAAKHVRHLLATIA